jgi:hypothetical protein
MPVPVSLLEHPEFPTEHQWQQESHAPMQTMPDDLTALLEAAAG